MKKKKEEKWFSHRRTRKTQRKEREGPKEKRGDKKMKRKTVGGFILLN